MPPASGVMKNGPASRKRVDADPGAMKRASGGSAFTRCEGCQKDVPIATFDMHDCGDLAAMKASLDKLGKEAAEKVKVLDKADKSGKRKVGGKDADKKSKKIKAADEPKRPPSGYFIFMDDFRASWKADNPAAKMTDISKQGGLKWKSLSDEEKRPYLEKAAEKKAEYKEAMESYHAGSRTKAVKADEVSEEGSGEEVAEEGGGESQN